MYVYVKLGHMFNTFSKRYTPLFSVSLVQLFLLAFTGTFSMVFVFQLGNVSRESYNILFQFLLVVSCAHTHTYVYNIFCAFYILGAFV